MQFLFVLLYLGTSTVGWVGGRVAGWVVGKLESNAKLNSKVKVEVEVEVGVELGNIANIGKNKDKLGLSWAKLKLS